MTVANDRLDDEDRVSGVRPVKRWRLLLAHDVNAGTCDPLINAIPGALGSFELSESSSVDDADLALDTGRYDVGLVCLDLPPAPTGGARLAQRMVSMGLPVILVTRSLRWIPASAKALHDLPWLPPHAGSEDLLRAVGEAKRAANAKGNKAPSSSRWLARIGATLPPADEMAYEDVAPAAQRVSWY